MELNPRIGYNVAYPCQSIKVAYNDKLVSIIL